MYKGQMERRNKDDNDDNDEKDGSSNLCGNAALYHWYANLL